MSGPLPKDPRLRQRRNRITTAATLPLVRVGARVPQLPRRRPDRRPWHPSTRIWWTIMWESPMAVEFLGSDVPALLVLAVLRDQFARDPRTALAAEIRLQEQRFGLSPLDRRRLQWEVERVEARHAPSSGRSLARGRDPRAGLHLVE